VLNSRRAVQLIRRLLDARLGSSVNRLTHRFDSESKAPHRQKRRVTKKANLSDSREALFISVVSWDLKSLAALSNSTFMRAI
jgi:hypothetical protein